MQLIVRLSIVFVTVGTEAMIHICLETVYDSDDGLGTAWRLCDIAKTGTTHGDAETV